MKTRIEVISNNPEAFALAIPRPTGEATKVNFGGYVTAKLEEATAAKVEILDFQGLPESGKNSEMFQNINFVEEALVNHLMANEYPKKVRIICDSETMDNMYRVVFNFYYADTKAARLDVEEDHEHE